MDMIREGIIQPSENNVILEESDEGQTDNED